MSTRLSTVTADPSRETLPGPVPEVDDSEIGNAQGIFQGRTLNGYRFDQLLAEGGMGTVYLATHMRLQRTVAVKVLPPHLAREEDLIARFQQEARVLATLDNPTVVPIYDLFYADGYFCIAMKFVKGGSLKDLLIRDGALEEKRAAELVKQAALGLWSAAQAGVVHRDIKPDNLLLSEKGDVLIADFGVAKMLQAEKPLTVHGESVGTPGYMSPEQWEDCRQVDHRSDLYSLGCALHELLAGDLPFAGPSSVNYMKQHTFRAPPDLREVRPGLSSRIRHVVAKLLAKKPEDRFQTGEELAAALDAVILGEPEDETPTVTVLRSPSEAKAPRKRKSPPTGEAAERKTTPPARPTGQTTPPRRPSRKTTPRRPSGRTESPRRPSHQTTPPRRPSGRTEPRRPSHQTTPPRRPSGRTESPRRPSGRMTPPRPAEPTPSPPPQSAPPSSERTPLPPRAVEPELAAPPRQKASDTLFWVVSLTMLLALIVLAVRGLMLRENEGDGGIDFEHGGTVLAASWYDTSPVQLEASDAGLPLAIRTATGLTLCLIPSGSFPAGSPAGEPGRMSGETLHTVSLRRPFYMKSTEVTQAEWHAVMESRPASFSEAGGQAPVENISWYDALEYCNELSRREGLEEVYLLADVEKRDRSIVSAEVHFKGLDRTGYRLPTESEWERACRAGSVTALYNGQLDPGNVLVSERLLAIAWYAANSAVDYGGGTDLIGLYRADSPELAQLAAGALELRGRRFGPHPVAGLEPNRFGLYDMLGNVGEWCWDHYAPFDVVDVQDPQGPRFGTTRVWRGGAWSSLAGGCRSATRGSATPDTRAPWIGLRPVRSVPLQSVSPDSSR